MHVATNATLLNCPDRAHLAYGMREGAWEVFITRRAGGRPQGASTREARRGHRARAPAAAGAEASYATHTQVSVANFSVSNMYMYKMYVQGMLPCIVDGLQTGYCAQGFFSS